MRCPEKGADRLFMRLLGHGIVTYEVAAWTGAHDGWLGTEGAPRLTAPVTRVGVRADYNHNHVLRGRPSVDAWNWRSKTLPETVSSTR